MEIFHIDVLGPGPALGELGDGQSSTVVFKDGAMNCVLVMMTGNPSSFISMRMHWMEMAALVAVASAMNSASVLDRVILVCICEFQNRGHPA